MTDEHHRPDIDHLNSSEEYDLEKCTRHPARLRGKAIGMWYAQRNRANRTTTSAPSSRQQIRNESIATVTLTQNEMERTKKVCQSFDCRMSSEIRIKSSSIVDDRVEQKLSMIDEQHPVPFRILHSSFEYFQVLEQRSDVDQRLLDDLEKKQKQKNYQMFFTKRRFLPIAPYREKILQMMEQNQIFIIVGETGSGKTTQTAQYILDHYIQTNRGSICRIICSQPRRISATSVAERVAQERGEAVLGDSVGYHIRLAAQFPRRDGSILFCTTGMLLKYIEQYSQFEHFSHIILDEIHERNIEMDFLLIFVRRLIKLRSGLKVVLMSASIQAEKFSAYFDGCPILHIPGNLYPVEEFYLEDFITTLRYPLANFSSRRSARLQEPIGENQNDQFKEYLDELQYDLASQKKPIEVWRMIISIGTDFHTEINCQLVVSTVELICRKSSTGTILVFLPGWNEIVKCTHLLRQENHLASYLHILPLHSLLPLHDQHEIFRPAPRSNMRKVILSTSIAETSITIDDVIYVIDTGRTKRSDFDIETQGKSLLPANVSKANLLQRKGRAGRTQPGACYRLFTRCNERRSFPDFPQAEMMSSRLDKIYLQAKLLKIDNVKLFLLEALDAPSLEGIEFAETFLVDIDALVSKDGDLTGLGQILAHLPMSPQIGKLLVIGYLFSCFDPILTIASILSYKDPFVCPFEKTDQINFIRHQYADKKMSDHLMLLKIFQQWQKQCTNKAKDNFCYENFLNSSHMMMIDRVRVQLKNLILDYFGSSNNQMNRNSSDTNLICALMCAGLYPNIARVRLPNGRSSRKPCQWETKLEKNIQIHPKSVNSKLREDDIHRSLVQSQFVVFHEKIRTSCVFIHDTSFISSYSLLFFGKTQFSTDSNTMDNDEDAEEHVILVDNWIKIIINRETNNLIKNLKTKFNHLLESTASSQNVLINNQKELIETIIDLITKKDKYLFERKKLIDDYETKNMAYEDWDDE